MAVINGTSGADTLADTSGDDTINGLAGNDTINGGSGGSDVVNGGDGRDTLAFMTATGAVVVDFVAGVAGTTSFTNIEKVVTGDFNDLLTGDGAAQNLTARAGADTLEGGGGVDTLWGGAGADTFIFRELGTANADSFGDWTSGQDTLLLDGAVMTALGASGDFTAGDARFWSSSTGAAHDGDDRIIYNSTTRQIYYDADGNGSGAAQLIATLQTGATLVATDIAIEGDSGPAPTVGTEGNDSLTGTAGDDTINGLSGNDTITGLAGDDSIDGGAGRDNLFGGEGNDTLIAGSSDGTGQANFLDGGPGADSMVGEADSDTFVVDNAGDVVVDGGGTGHDAVFSSVSFTAGDGIEQLTLTGSASIDATGNSLNNNLHGTSGANRLDGLGGNDWMDGLGGADSLLGGDGADTLFSGDGNDTINGGTGNDRLDGGAGHDWLVGGEGSDTFLFGQWATAPNDEFIADFQSGVDLLQLDEDSLFGLGASGTFSANDARFYSAAGATEAYDVSDRIIYNTTNGNLYFDADGSGSTWQAQLIATLQGGATLAASDIVVINGTAPNGATVTGTAGNDSLLGTWGDDQMEGLAGDDTMRASDGYDLVLGGDGDDSLFGEWGNDILEGGAGHDWLEGGSGTDVLRGGDGNDTLDGGSGTNVLYTGAGTDRVLFLYESWAATTRIHDFAPGTDELAFDRAVMTEIGAAGDFVAGDERFHIGAAAAEADDRLVYNSSNGQLLYDADGSGSIAAEVIAQLNPGTALTATDITVIDSDAPRHIVGTSGNDTLYGRAGGDTIEGLAGNDYIYAAEGNDSLLGGDGDDYIHTGEGSDTADGGAGNDTIYGASDYYDGGDGEPERHAGGEGDDRLYGGDGDDALSGDGGHDSLWGGGGTDTLDGGLGNDTMVAGPEWDGVIIDAGGIDTIIAVQQDWTLGAGFENLRVTASDWDYYDAGDRILIGNGLDNHIDGSDASSAHIQGLDGNDTLLGGWGGYGDTGVNILDGGSGNDVLSGTSLTDRLIGGTGNDSLEASYGADVLDGGEGNDTLVGGASTEWAPGGDLFRFSVTAGDANADRIVDFVSGDDTIEFIAAAYSGIGASGYFAADDERFHAAAGATGGAEADDRVIYDTSTGNLYYDADGSGSGAALLVATLQNAPTLVAGDLVVTGGPTVGTAGNDSITGTPADDTIDGGAGDDSLQGGAGSDHLIGGDGNDSLDGGLHADTLDGGLGDDSYFADDGDVLIDAGGVDHVTASSWTLGDGFENLTASSGVGNSLDNRLTGHSGSWANLSGEQGNDTLEAAGGSLSGGEGNDVIRATSFAATLRGGDGNDSITGSGGGDAIYGNRGNDTMAGGAGSDHFYLYNTVAAEGVAYGQDQIDGGEGTDWIRFDFGDGRASGIVADLNGGTVSGGGATGDSATLVSIESVVGSELNDSISGSAAANSLFGGSGADFLDGRAGNDSLNGGGGADVFSLSAAAGTANADVIVDFVSGTDRIQLDGSVMSSLGGSGAFASGDERFHIGAAAAETDDRVVYNSSNGQLFYDADGSGSGAAELIATLSGARPLAANDIVVVNSAPPPSGNVINGTSGADTLADTAGNDTINGLAGNDTINGGHGGNDVVNGGDGRDTLAFMSATSAVVVDFVAGTAGNASFTEIEKVVTGDFNDALTGNAAAQNLTARSGADTLAGAGGVDTLWGGAGADTFIFREAGTANADTIGDWTSGSDEIELDNAAMAALGEDGDFVAGDARFWASSTGTAHDADDRVIYNTNTRSLYYDADGDGSGAAQLIATVQAGAAIAATDISIV